MPTSKRTVIVGVGLLGGSLGLALRQRQLSEHVVGWGRRQATLDQAREMGAVDETSTNLSSACEGADVVVVCTPVRLVAELVVQAAAVVEQDCLITDVGSTKAGICSELESVSQFCGAHPLAGSDKSGVGYADPGLFQNKLTVITPGPQTSENLAKRVIAFWESVGSRTERMTPTEHDVAVAATSHLPHVVASAVAAATPESLLPLAASGWCDTTRVAAGSVELWLQIIQENRESLLAALENFGQSLEQWTEAVRQQDDSLLEQLLTKGKQRRDSVGN